MSARRKKIVRSKLWETCLRIPPQNTNDVVPAVDDAWFAAKGVYSSAPDVIRLLQQDVSPAIKSLQTDGLDWFFFLVHDRNSGVPTTKDDPHAYIHIRLVFKRARMSLASWLPRHWLFTRPILTEGDSIGGVANSLLYGGDEPAAHARRLIGYQSEWVLRFLDAHRSDGDPAAMMQQCRQFLHYFANMLQMKAVG